MVAPIKTHTIDFSELARIPGAETCCRTRTLRQPWKFLAYLQIGFTRKPGQAQLDCSGLTRRDLEGNEQAGPWTGSAFGDGRAFRAYALRHIAPGHRERVPPPTAEPGMVHLDRRFGNRCRKSSFFPGPVFRPPAPKDKPSLDRANRLRVLSNAHEVFRIERKYCLNFSFPSVDEAILERCGRQARVIGITWDEWAPAS